MAFKECKIFTIFIISISLSPEILQKWDKELEEKR